MAVNGSKGKKPGFEYIVPVVPKGAIVFAKQDLSGVPADGRRKREHIPAGTTGIVEDGIVRAVNRGEPDLRFISFEKGRSVVCMAVDPTLVAVI